MTSKQKNFIWFSFLVPWFIKCRLKLYYIFEKNIPPKKHYSVLDLGVSNNGYNYFHKGYPYTSKIKAAGLAQKDYFLQKESPQIQYIPVKSTFPYPFRNNEFDIVHASAVIEHVGSRARQKMFMKEAYRIGKRGMISTPNKDFPVDFHTWLPFLHWLPNPLYKKIINFLGFKDLDELQNLNFISLKEIEDMAIELNLKNWWLVKHSTFGLISNYLLFWDKNNEE